MEKTHHYTKESHYRALFEQTNDGVFIISLDLTYLAVNQQAADMLGYAIEELEGMSVNAVAALEQKNQTSNTLALATGSHAQPIYERIYKRKDGSTFPVEISTSIVSDQEGKPLHIQSIVRDITERKLAEAALLRRDEILEAVSFAAEEFMRSSDWETSVQQVLRQLGKAADVECVRIYKIHYDSNDEIIATALFDRMATDFENFTQAGNLKILDFRDRHLVNWKEALCDIHGVFSNLREPTLDEQQFLTKYAIQSIAIVPVSVHYKLWGLIGFFDLATTREWSKIERDALVAAANIIGAAIQRKESEIELRHSEARTRAILDALPDLVFRIDQSGNILDFSVNEKHPLYLPRETVVGSHSSKIWPQVITDLMMEKVNLVIERKSATPIEFVFSSSERTYEVRLDGLGKHEVLGIVRDITDRARLEQMKSDFINRASHELRTPLTTSILMTDLIKEGGTEDEVEEYWQILTNELQRQKNLIDRFLVAGRLENNMLAIEAVPLALVPIIDESIAAVNPLAKKKNIEIAKDLPDKLPKILGDESSLQQVFINLINNAIKFSPEGSQVTVQVKDNANSVSTKITDQGIGIPENDQAHLFERFFRARNVNIAEIPGSGVGLYIVKSIIEELGGEILVSSVIGEGTTLEVKLLHSLSETTGVNPKHSIINSIETPH